MRLSLGLCRPNERPGKQRSMQKVSPNSFTIVDDGKIYEVQS